MITNPQSAAGSSPEVQTRWEYSYKPIILSFVLQLAAIVLVKVGMGAAATGLIYAIVLLALLYGIILRNLLMAVAILLSSVGTSIIFRDNLLSIFYNTYPYTYILLSLVWVFYGARKPLTKVLPLALAFGFFLFSGLWSSKPIPYGTAVRLVGAVATLTVMYLAIKDAEDLELLVVAVILGTIALVPGVAMFQSGEDRFGILEVGDRPDYGNPIAYMGHVTAWTIVGLGLILSNCQLKYKKFLIAGVIGMLGVLIWSTSRTCLAVVAVASVPIFWRALGRRTARTLMLIAAILTVFTIVIIKNRVAREYLVDRLVVASKSGQNLINRPDSFLTSQDLDKISTGRWYLIRKSFELFKINPLIGVGFGNSNIKTEFKMQVIHSFWVKLLAETGIIGTLAFLLILGYQFFAYIVNSNKTLPGLSLGLFLGMLLYGMAAHGLDLVMWGMYGTALAVAELSADTLLSQERY